MKVSKAVLLSAEILAAHKLRTALSLAGVVIGVASLMMIVGLSKAAEHRILARIRSMGTNLLVVTAAPARGTAGRKKQVETVTSLVPADARAIAEDCPTVASAAAAFSRQTQVRWEGTGANTTVLAASPEVFAIRNLSLAKGRFFDDDEGRLRSRVAVLGSTVVERLFGNQDPQSQSIRIGSLSFEVIGSLVRKGVDAHGTDQDDVVIIPLETGLRRVWNVNYIQTVFIQAVSGNDLNRTEGDVRSLLRERHRLDRKADTFSIQSQTRLIETERAASESLSLLVGGVAGVSLLVGGIGILAVMLISVRERRGEIGVRRAVGARRRDILVQFLLESTGLAAGGGALGVLLGLLGTRGAPYLGIGEALLSWPAAGTGFGVALGVGIAFGLVPALRAAHLDPIEALRSN